MFDFCSSKIYGVSFRLIQKKELDALRETHKLRYEGVTTIPGTHSFHQFIPLGNNNIGTKRCSSDNNFTTTHVLLKSNQVFEK